MLANQGLEVDTLTFSAVTAGLGWFFGSKDPIQALTKKTTQQEPVTPPKNAIVRCSAAATIDVDSSQSSVRHRSMQKIAPAALTVAPVLALEQDDSDSAYIHERSMRYPVAAAVGILLHELISKGMDLSTKTKGGATSNKKNTHDVEEREVTNIFIGYWGLEAAGEGQQTRPVQCREVVDFLISCYKVARWPSAVHVHSMVSPVVLVWM
jgi:hypothetical protein